MSLDAKNWLQENRGNSNLLGVCPMTEEIIRASIKEAAETDFTPMFIATPRQVDADRGYTGWSQRELIDFVESVADDFDYNGPYLIARDHGGPYQSKRDRGNAEVGLEEAMSYAKEMFTEDVRAGFDIIHVDATEDSRKDGILDLEEVARRTVELIEHIEKVREDEDLSKVYYEVGTEEISGGMTEPEDFERFIELLKNRLTEEDLQGVLDQLLFIVGQVGTTMRIDMENNFNPEQAKTLVNIASDHDLFLKVHYTDWLENSTLERFPEIGIGAANVGPEFAAAIVDALIELEEEEKSALESTDEEVQKSGLMETLEEAALEGAPWKKFSPEDLEGEELEEFGEENKRNIATCVGRYVLNNPEVKEARKRLYENIKEYSSIEDVDGFVIGKIKDAIDRYVQAFNLRE